MQAGVERENELTGFCEAYGLVVSHVAQSLLNIVQVLDGPFLVKDNKREEKGEKKTDKTKRGKRIKRILSLVRLDDMFFVVLRQLRPVLYIQLHTLHGQYLKTNQFKINSTEVGEERAGKRIGDKEA